MAVDAGTQPHGIGNGQHQAQTPIEIVIGVYLHIPFCRTLCPYCDFVKRPLAEGRVPTAFIDSLCAEIEGFEGPDDADTIFFGGGTPSLVDTADLGRILDCLHSRFTLHEPEITVEANPDDVTEALVDGWRDAGINRVSLGVQSFDDDVLRYLGRRHGADGAKHACDIVADRFENWSLDLMFGAQPIAAWPATLAECARRHPPHFSAYGLTFEPTTPFGARTDDAVDDETYLSLCAAIDRVMTGYVRYEISNYALPGMECRHNLHYWRNEAYAGFGPGAYSYIDGVRARNHSNLDRYLESPGVKTESISLNEREQRVETLIQFLRLRSGLPKQNYSERFGAPPELHFGAALASLESRGLIATDAQRIRPTDKGFELNNEIGLALVG